MEIRVNISDYKVVRHPDTLVTIGLGSCVGIVLYDKYSGIMGMAHIMLPRSTDYVNADNKMKFADTCIPLMLEDMVKMGANKDNIKAKIAGGANMFSNMSLENIGGKNSEEVIKTLNNLKIPILAKELGGSKGRTLFADPLTGDVYSRAVGMGKKLL